MLLGSCLSRPFITIGAREEEGVIRLFGELKHLYLSFHDRIDRLEVGGVGQKR